MLPALALLMLAGCQKQKVSALEEKSEVVSEASYDEAMRKASLITTTFYRKRVADRASVARSVDSLFALQPTIFGDDVVRTRSASEASYAAKAVVEMLQEVNPFEYDTKSDYIDALGHIIEGSRQMLSDFEIAALRVSAQIAADIIQQKYGVAAETDGVKTRGWWGDTKRWLRKQWNDWGQCAASIVGEAGIGALGGAAAGSVVPGLGTTAGAIAGGISGGLHGASAEVCSSEEVQ